VTKLQRYARLLAAGCPLERHELTDNEWLIVGMIRDEEGSISMQARWKDSMPNGRREHPGLRWIPFRRRK